MIKAAIEFTRAVATVEFKRAIATVEFQSAIAAVEIQRSLSAIELRRALAAIEFGDFMTFKFFTDQSMINDAIVTAVNKLLADSSTINDLAAKEINKGVIESSSIADSFDSLLSKILAENPALTDSYNALLNKQQDEPITLSLSTVKSIEKTPLIEGLGVGELISRQSIKTFLESSALTDSQNAILNKRPDESISLAFSAVKSIEKTVTDSVAITHRFSVPGKILTSEQAGAQYDQSIALNKPFADSFSTSDLHTASAGKVFTDRAAGSDSGSAFLQNYAADYFADDYVGERRGWLDTVSSSETPSAIDSATKQSIKTFSDSGAITDSQNAILTKRPDESITLSFSTNTQNYAEDYLPATLSLSTNKNIGRSSNDSTSVTHSGSAFLQNYATDYFADDYVGEKRTF